MIEPSRCVVLEYCCTGEVTNNPVSPLTELGTLGADRTQDTQDCCVYMCRRVWIRAAFERSPEVGIRSQSNRRLPVWPDPAAAGDGTVSCMLFKPLT